MKRYRTVRREKQVAVVDERGERESMHASQELADIRLAALVYPVAWKKRIAESLPAKLEADARHELTSRIAERIETWHKSHPEIYSHRQKLVRLSREAKRIRAALQREHSKLAGSFPDAGHGEHSADGALRAVVARAIHSLTAWDGSWRPSDSRHPEFHAELVSALKEEFNVGCGPRTRGFSVLLGALQREAVQRLLSKHREKATPPVLKPKQAGKPKRRKVAGR